MYILLFCLVQAALCARLQDVRSSDDSCDTMFCALGSECVERSGIPECECLQRCEEDNAPVCGRVGKNNTKTYESECELYRQACLQKDTQTIVMVSPISCEEDKEVEKELTKEIERNLETVKPVVCMQKDRDNLREAILKFIKERLNIKYDDVTSYKGLLLQFFLSLDTDGDNALDTMEFVKISAEEMITEDSLKTNAILRGLCTSELIAITDHNSDYKLEFEEFHECLNPTFTPPKEECEADGKFFDDGDDIPIGCNTCKCACGHWVCTHNKCEDDNSSRGKFGL